MVGGEVERVDGIVKVGSDLMVGIMDKVGKEMEGA